MNKSLLIAALLLVANPAYANLTVGIEDQVTFDYRASMPEYPGDPPNSVVLNELSFKGHQKVTTECITEHVTERLRRIKNKVQPGELIVEAVESCVWLARGLIDAFDQMWGKGGEAFFMGPYLDSIHQSVVDLIKKWNSPKKSLQQSGRPK